MKPFPLASVLLLLLFLALGCGQSKEIKFKIQGAEVIRSKTESGLIQYGILTTGKVGYVSLTVFKKEKKEFPAMVTVETNASYLTTPDGTIIKLPAPDQLFESIDGKFSSSKFDISEQALKKYLEKDHEEYSIEKIIEFTKSAKKTT